MRIICLILLVLFTYAGGAWAEAPPSPPKKQSLKAMEQELKATKKNQQKLDEQAAAIKKEIEETRERMVKLGASVKKNEARLQDLERALEDKERERDALHEALDEDRKSMARLILALQRIRRLPPEAIFARPGAPLETAQSAMLLSEIIPVLDTKADNLRANIEHLKAVTESIRTDRADALKTAENLKEEQAGLEKLIDKRENLYAQTQSDLKTAEARIREISAQSRTLRDLISRLDRERQRQEEQRRSAPAETDVSSPLTPMPLPPAGAAQLPVSGIVKVRYQEPDAFGAPSEGITIVGRGGGLVVAPMSGVVRYAGTFKNYGNMVIIEHDGGYHSLIAGLEKIDTVVSRSVAGGEPVGSLKPSSQDAKPSLYYELRLHGRPVNPAKKFAELG